MDIDGDLAELIGIHVGDGCISKTKKYSEYYLGGDLNEEKDYHNTWVKPLFDKKIMIPLFDKKIQYKEYPKTGVYGFYIFNKELVNFFEKLGIKAGSKNNIKIPLKIIKNKELALRFLRGLFDTDGNLYFDKNRSSKNPINNCPTIKLGTVSKSLADQVFNLFRKLGLNPRMKKPYKGKRDKNPVHTVLLYRKNDILFFMENINFKNAKHKTKWEIFKKQGYCPPKTTLIERKTILNI